MFVTIEHEDGSNTYLSYYRHLSAIFVDENERVVQGQPIGTSGNTGFTRGAMSPNPGRHLHFEVKLGSKNNNNRTNPHGWQAPAETPDPWELYSGIASNTLWADDVAVPGPEPIFDDMATVIIDSDNNTDPTDGFHSGCAIGPCVWESMVQVPDNNDDDFVGNDDVFQIKEQVNLNVPNHWAEWRPYLAQPGCYEVLAFIPRPNPAGLEITLANPEYTINYHDGQNTVILDQRKAQGQFVSLGFYPFQGGANNEDEYVRVTDKAFAVNGSDPAGENDWLAVDAVAFVPVTRYTPVTCQPTMYVSLTADGSVDGLTFADEDILAFEPQTNEWSMFFDGSDIGLGGSSGQGQGINLDAFQLLADNTILLSHNADDGVVLPDVGLVDDADVLLFTPSALGSDTDGTFTLYLDGSTVGLTTNFEDIDGLSLLADGRLVVST